MSDQRSSEEESKRETLPSFIEPRPPLILNPFMRPRPQKGMNLLELFEEDSEFVEPEWLQVYLRLKPCNVPSNLYEVKSDRCLITSVDTATAGHGRRTQHNVSKMYQFTHIFGTESNQKEIFENVVKENLKKLPEGFNFTLLSYGASGSGKTYTLMGTVAAPGLVPRSLEYVFRVVEAAQYPLYKPADNGPEKLDSHRQDDELQWVKNVRQLSLPQRDKYKRMSIQLRNETVSSLDLTKRTRYYVWVSFVEIYNEAIYDLLTYSDRSKATSKLRIREDSNGNAYVKGARQAFVRSGEEAYDVLVAGKLNLQVAATGVHAHSSRSHCIFTITLLTETEGGVRSSFVRLCDLAGSERARQTHNTGARMQESRAINTSLHVLERCLHMLRRRQRMKVDTTMVPYRESKLTRLLGAGLSGARGEAVSMVVTLNPAPQYAQETRHVLQLAAVAKDIQINQTTAEMPQENSEDTTVECSDEVLRLRTEIERLHYELVQAESRIKELTAASTKKRMKNAKVMEEIVEDTKRAMQEYYERRLEAMREQMEEMKEEFTRELEEAKRSASTLSRSSWQNKVEQLIANKAVLEETLSQERLALVRAEAEIIHLRACIEERDEKSSNYEQVIDLLDSESDDGEDPYNESLEPTFKKNRSRIQQNCDDNDVANTTLDNRKLDCENNDDTVETVKHVDDAEDSTCEVDKHQTSDSSVERDANDTLITENESREVKEQRTVEQLVTDKRATYFVKDSGISYGSNFNSASFNSVEEDYKDSSNDNVDSTETSDFKNKTSSMSCKTSCKGDSSLAQFEELESDVKTSNSNLNKMITENIFDNAKISLNLMQVHINKGKKIYFDDTENVCNKATEMAKEQILVDDRSPSIVKDEVSKDFEPNTIKKLLGQSFTRQSESIPDQKMKHFSVDFFESPQNIVDSACKSIQSSDHLEPMLHKHITFDEKSNNLTMNQEIQAEIVPQKSILETKIRSDKGPDFTANSNLKTNVDTGTELDQTGSVETLCQLYDFYNIAKPQTVVSKNTSTVKTCASANVKVKSNIIDTASAFNISQKNLEVHHLVPADEDLPNQADQLEIITQKSIVDTATNYKSNASIIESCIVKEKRKMSSIQIDNSCVGTSSGSEQKYVALKSLTDPKEKMPIVELKSLDAIAAPEQNTYKLTKKTSSKEDVVVSIPVLAVDETEIGKESKDLQFCDRSIFQVFDYNINSEENNTLEDFENIYKDVTLPRTTAFDLLVPQDSTAVDKTSAEPNLRTENPKYNLRAQTDAEDKDKSQHEYNLRQKSACKKKIDPSDIVLIEEQAKTERKTYVKRNLGLRQRKHESDEEKSDQEKNVKLKDIVNLQVEFSDITLDKPAAIKDVKDIASPEKEAGEKNLPPMYEVQSCSSKSVPRSRRKLYTPRAEPPEESPEGSAGISAERVRVPRPPNHKPGRARRRL